SVLAPHRRQRRELVVASEKAQQRQITRPLSRRKTRTPPRSRPRPRRSSPRQPRRVPGALRPPSFELPLLANLPYSTVSIDTHLPRRDRIPRSIELWPSMNRTKCFPYKLIVPHSP